MFGQIPRNGGYRGGNGIFGQIPGDGGYDVGGAARGPIFGYGQMPVFIQPPSHVENGLIRIDEGSRDAFKSSMDMAFTTDQSHGSMMTIDPIFGETVKMEIAAAAPGNNWLSELLNAGEVILFRGKGASELSPTLSFISTKNANAIAAYAADPSMIPSFASQLAPYRYMVIDGNDALISYAKKIINGQAPPLPEVVPDLPVTPVPPGTTPAATSCGPGQILLNGQCWDLPSVPIPGFPMPPPGATPPPGAMPLPGITPTPGYVPQPTTQPAQQAAAKAPGWVLPALIGITGVSLLVIVMSSRKRGSSRRM